MGLLCYLGSEFSVDKGNTKPRGPMRDCMCSPVLFFSDSDTRVLLCEVNSETWIPFVSTVAVIHIFHLVLLVPICILFCAPLDHVFPAGTAH